MRVSRRLSAFRLRLRSLFRRNAVERELDDEIRYHLERQIEQNLTKGMSAKEARYAARRVLGRDAAIKERLREVRGWNSLGAVARDVHYAFRLLRRSPVVKDAPREVVYRPIFQSPTGFHVSFHLRHRGTADC
jgi:hypothetical protein